MKNRMMKFYIEYASESTRWDGNGKMKFAKNGVDRWEVC